MSGSNVPTVRPKLWKIGMALNSRSVSMRSVTASIWRTLARRLRWLSSTPLGTPSEPLVKRMTAVLECGDSSPLFAGATCRAGADDESSPRESGDESPHSKAAAHELGVKVH